MTKIVIKESGEVIPAGIYVLRVNNITVQTAKTGDNAGNSFLAWEDDILEAPEEAQEFLGSSYKHTTPVGCSPRSKYYKLFTSLGISLSDGQKSLEFDTDELLGREFVADILVSKVAEGKNKGNDKNEFKDIWSIPEFQKHMEEMTKHVAKSKLLSTQAPIQNTVNKSPIERTVTPSTQKSSVLGGQSHSTTDVKKPFDTFPE